MMNPRTDPATKGQRVTSEVLCQPSPARVRYSTSGSALGNTAKPVRRSAVTATELGCRMRTHGELAQLRTTAAIQMAKSANMSY